MRYISKKISVAIILSVLSINVFGVTNNYAFVLDNNTSSTESSVSSLESGTQSEDSIEFVRNKERWVVDDNIDFSSYDFLGPGGELIEEILEKKYPDFSINYYYNNNNSKTKVSENAFKKLLNVMAKYTVDNSKKVINVTYDKIKIRVLPEYTSVSGKEGTTFNIKFTTNLPTKFRVNIDKDKNTNGVVYCENVEPTGKDGTYTASVEMTIPYIKDYNEKYYINFKCDSAGYSTWVKRIPISITPGNNTKKNHLYFSGEWDMIKSDTYKKNQEKYFYSQYPRLSKRWNAGAKDIILEVENTEGVAWWNGSAITLCTDFANKNPDSYGPLIHELTHATQKERTKKIPTLVYPDGSKTEWWIEGHADYGRFRYFHWAFKDQINDYTFDYTDMAKVRYNSDGSVYRFDWLGSAGKADNGEVDKIHWFFAWMDYNYPTTKDANGNIKYGLVDTIYYALADGTYNDNIFLAKTGYTMFELMEKYTKDVNEKGWRFTGFANYPDNWVTEDIEGLENPEYPSIENTES